MTITYNEYYEEFKKELGDDVMEKLDKILSATEKRNSFIFPIDPVIPLNKVYDSILLKKEYWKGNDTLVRIIFKDGFVMKLQTKDNGTPIIYVFDKEYARLYKIASRTKVFCKLNELVYTEIEC